MTPAWHPALRSIKVPPSEYPSEHASFIPTSSDLLGVAARCHGSKIGRLPSSRPRAKGGTVRQGRGGGGNRGSSRMCQSSILTCIQCDGGGAQRLARRRARGTAGGTVDCRGRGIEGCRCCSQNILNIGILLNVQGLFLQGLGAAGKKGYWSCCGWWLGVCTSREAGQPPAVWDGSEETVFLLCPSAGYPSHRAGRRAEDEGSDGRRRTEYPRSTAESGDCWCCCQVKVTSTLVPANDAVWGLTEVMANRA